MHVCKRGLSKDEALEASAFNLLPLIQLPQRRVVWSTGAAGCVSVRACVCVCVCLSVFLAGSRSSSLSLSLLPFSPPLPLRRHASTCVQLRLGRGRKEAVHAGQLGFKGLVQHPSQVLRRQKRRAAGEEGCTNGTATSKTKEKDENHLPKPSSQALQGQGPRRRPLEHLGTTDTCAPQ